MDSSDKNLIMGGTESESDARDTTVGESEWTTDNDDSDEELMSDMEPDEENEVDDDILKELQEDLSEVFNTTVVPKDRRITSDFLTKKELAQVISSRAAQIEKGAPIFIPLEHYDNATDIAVVELREGRMPFIIKRACPHGIEYWNIRELNYNPEHLNRSDRLAYKTTLD